jgi:hypothetical protein
MPVLKRFDFHGVGPGGLVIDSPQTIQNLSVFGTGREAMRSQSPDFHHANFLARSFVAIRAAQLQLYAKKLLQGCHPQPQT